MGRKKESKPILDYQFSELVDSDHNIHRLGFLSGISLSFAEFWVGESVLLFFDWGWKRRQMFSEDLDSFEDIHHPFSCSET